LIPDRNVLAMVAQRLRRIATESRDDARRQPVRSSSLLFMRCAGEWHVAAPDVQGRAEEFTYAATQIPADELRRGFSMRE